MQFPLKCVFGLEGTVESNNHCNHNVTVNRLQIRIIAIIKWLSIDYSLGLFQKNIFSSTGTHRKWFVTGQKEKSQTLIMRDRFGSL